MHLLLVCVLLLLSGCDLIADFTGSDENDKNETYTQLSLAVAPHIAWMPWYLADEEGIFHQYAPQYKIEVQFISDNYQDTIDKFISKKVDAIAISNIDAVAQLVKHNIKTDVILITNYSQGNNAIVLPPHAANHSKKTFALNQDTASHYLLDRYLIKNQIAFNSVKILNTGDVDISSVFLNKKIFGVVTHNPNIYRLTRSADGEILFDSSEIPKEIFDFIVIHRESLRKHPGFAEVLLSTWFSIMNRLQGSKKSITLEALASLANISHQDYKQQLTSLPLNDTPNKALAAIRDGNIRKDMRHLRYFVERHKLNSEEPFTNWISYPGRTPALLHFNGQLLQNFVVSQAKDAL